MVQTNNGRADASVIVPLELGDFLAERREVIINGQTYLAWVTTHNRYPRNIMARLDRASREYNRTIAPLLPVLGQDLSQATESIQNSPERLDALEAQPEAWDRYVTQCVLLLIPNLLESEIELVDLASLERLLRELGYFQPLQAQEATESPAPPLTGDSSPPDLLVSTLDTTISDN